MHTLQEILQRKKEIFDQKQSNMEKAKETKAKGGDNMRSLLESIAADQEKLDLELRDLIFEEIEVRSKVEESNPISTPIADNKDKEEQAFEELNRLSKRQKLCLSIGKQFRKKEFTAVEKRALGTALTTTATTFVQATELANGVNNAGVFIQTNLIFDLLKEEKKLSPILEDVAFTNIKGLTTFPYRKSRDKANYKAEGARGIDNQLNFDTLDGVKGYLQTIIVVTDEVLALSDIDFGAYILDEILKNLNEDWAEEIIYGVGTSGAIAGITSNAQDGSYSSNVLAAIETATKMLTGKYRRGAKIYVAQDIADDVLFAKDSHGDYIYPIFNNVAGIKNIGQLPVAVDENLHSGDFIVGNVKDYYKANSLIPLRVEFNRLARYGKTEYIASVYAATVPVPNAFVYGTYVAAQSNGGSDAAGGGSSGSDSTNSGSDAPGGGSDVSGGETTP